MESYIFTTLIFVSVFQALPSTASSCAPIDNVKLTFYGWPDNDPPGAGIGGNCGPKDAGGTGTFTDPITFATAPDNPNFPACGLVYVPSLHKYFRNEDTCADCTTDWDNSKQFHIDLWTGSSTQDGGQTQINCEDSLTDGGQFTIVNDPPDGLPVDTSLLFDVSSGACNKPNYPDDSTGLCSGGGSSPSATSSVLSSSLAVGNNRLYEAKYTPSTTFQTSVTSSGSSLPSSGCTWKGHCLGASCQTYNDCDGTNICGPDKTCVSLS